MLPVVLLRILQAVAKLTLGFGTFQCDVNTPISCYPLPLKLPSTAFNAKPSALLAGVFLGLSVGAELVKCKIQAIGSQPVSTCVWAWSCVMLECWWCKVINLYWW